MKIALVSHRFYPHIGGVETVVFQLASIMAAKGIDVTVLTQTHDLKLAKKERINNFTVRRFYEFGFSELRISFDLFRYLKKNSSEYDVIHVHNYHTFPAICVALTKKCPVIFSPHYHGTGHTTFTHFLHYPYRYIGKYIFSKSDATLSDSDAEMKLIKRHFPHITKTTLIPLGIDVEGIRQAKKNNDSSQYILAIGRLENYKNVELIIRSLQFIKSDVALKLVGDGPAKQELENIAQKLNLSGRISFLKNVSQEELYRLLKSAKAYVTMSRMEAYGIALLEATTAQLGIVASDIPAHRDLIKMFKINNISLLDPNSSPKDLASSLVIAMTTPSQSGEKLPSWDFVTEQTVQIYKEVLKKHTQL